MPKYTMLVFAALIVTAEAVAHPAKDQKPQESDTGGRVVVISDTTNNNANTGGESR